jgi:branched-chain amino acid transport system substrate-binding protein
MRKISRRAAIGTLAAGSAIIGAPSIRRATAQGAPLKIGHVGPMSGSAGSMGQRAVIGVDIAAKKINAAGGILGRQVEVLYRDDKASPAEAGLVTRDLMGQGCQIILGGWLTAPTNGTIPVVESEKGMLVVLGASQPAFTRDQFSKRMFRMIFDSVMYQYGRAISAARKYPNIRSWSVIMPDVEFAHVGYKVFVAATKQSFPAGTNITFHEPVLHKFGATDYKVQIAKLYEQRADALLTMNIDADTITFFQQAAATPLPASYKAIYENGFGEYMAEKLGANMPPNFWSFLSFWANAKDATAEAKSFYKEWIARTGKTDSDNLGAGGYTGLMSIMHAANQAKSLDIDALIAGLETVRFESVYGTNFGFRKEDHQGLVPTCNVKFAKKSSPPGWEIVDYDPVKAEQTMGPPTPGKKYEIPA